MRTLAYVSLALGCLAPGCVEEHYFGSVESDHGVQGAVVELCVDQLTGGIQPSWIQTSHQEMGSWNKVKRQMEIKVELDKTERLTQMNIDLPSMDGLFIEANFTTGIIKTTDNTNGTTEAPLSRGGVQEIARLVATNTSVNPAVHDGSYEVFDVCGKSLASTFSATVPRGCMVDQLPTITPPPSSILQGEALTEFALGNLNGKTSGIYDFRSLTVDLGDGASMEINPEAGTFTTVGMGGASGNLAQVNSVLSSHVYAHDLGSDPGAFEDFVITVSGDDRCGEGHFVRSFPVRMGQASCPALPNVVVNTPAPHHINEVLEFGINSVGPYQDVVVERKVGGGTWASHGSKTLSPPNDTYSDTPTSIANHQYRFQFSTAEPTLAHCNGQGPVNPGIINVQDTPCPSPVPQVDLIMDHINRSPRITRRFSNNTLYPRPFETESMRVDLDVDNDDDFNGFNQARVQFRPTGGSWSNVSSLLDLTDPTKHRFTVAAQAGGGTLRVRFDKGGRSCTRYSKTLTYNPESRYRDLVCPAVVPYGNSCAQEDRLSSYGTKPGQSCGHMDDAYTIDERRPVACAVSHANFITPNSPEGRKLYVAPDRFRPSRPSRHNTLGYAEVYHGRFATLSQTGCSKAPGVNEVFPVGPTSDPHILRRWDTNDDGYVNDTEARAAYEAHYLAKKSVCENHQDTRGNKLCKIVKNWSPEYHVACVVDEPCRDCLPSSSNGYCYCDSKCARVYGDWTLNVPDTETHWRVRIPSDPACAP